MNDCLRQFVAGKKISILPPLTIIFADMTTTPAPEVHLGRNIKRQLIGKQVVAVVNLPPKQIAGFLSECLVLGVYDENNDVILLQPERKLANGLSIG